MSGRASRTTATRPHAPNRPRPISHASEQDPLLSISSPLNYIPTVSDSPPASRRRRLRNSQTRSWSDWVAGLLVSSHASSPLASSSSLSSFPSRQRAGSHFPRTIPVARSPQNRGLCQRCLRPMLVVGLVVVVLLIAVSNRGIMGPGDNGDETAPYDRGRLPVAWVPSEYALDLVVDPEVETFSGRMSVRLKAVAPTGNITFHSAGLNFTLANVTVSVVKGEQPTGRWRGATLPDPAKPVPGEDEGDSSFIVPSSMVLSHKFQTVTLMLPTTMAPADVVTMTINYSGIMGYRTMSGFYRSPYTTDQVKRSRFAQSSFHHRHPSLDPLTLEADQSSLLTSQTRKKGKKKPSPPKKPHHLAATHFEPFGARHAFPCLDEPHLKAEYEISIEAPQHLEVISNSPVLRVDPSEGRKGWKVSKFAKTRRMSSYLVAWAVGDIGIGARGVSAGGTPVRVFGGMKGSGKEAVFALDVALASINLYEKQFGIPFPMPKLDLFPMPDFSGEGMENWGLSIFQEDGLLLSPDASSDERVYVSNLVAHEIAHQWLGDLTTMAWWNDLWLNEGFAEWAQHAGTDAAHPSWRSPSMFFEYEHMLGFEADVSYWSRPVWLRSVHPRSVGSMFDDIVYNKGASVIRMIQSWLDKPDFIPPSTRNGTSEEPCGRFCRSLKRYLQKHTDSVATTEDLLNALDDEEPSKIISRTVRGWIEGAGFPVVYVGSEGQLAQQRFTLWKTLTPPQAPSGSSNSSSWLIPFSFRYISRDASTVNQTNATRTVLIRPDAVVTLPSAPVTVPDPLLLANPDRVGFFRFLYTEEEYAAFASLLLTTPTILPAQDRAGLVSDVTAHLLSGRLSPGPAVSLLRFLAKETDPIVWRVAALSLQDMATVLSIHETYPSFRRFARSLINLSVDAVGFPLPNATGDFTVGFLRPVAIAAAVKFGRTLTIRACFDLFWETVEGGKGLPEFLKPVVGVVVVGAITFDPYLVIDAILSDLEKSIEMFGRETIINGLAASPHASHHEILLHLDDPGDTTLINPEILKSLATGSDHGHLIAWRNGIFARWNQIMAARADSRYWGEAIEKVVTRLDPLGADFRDALGLVGADPAGGVEEWRRGVVGERYAVSAVRRGLERAWAAGEFRRVCGEELGAALEGGGGVVE
ncbi:hypothetical protein HDU67_006570 [Dinochytrium kinnereticum]|nr:hypothetical protein HDU67_006570 [Dinochytrium kinnereticum]